jgi:hypothetical protein
MAVFRVNTTLRVEQPLYQKLMLLKERDHWGSLNDMLVSACSEFCEREEERLDRCGALMRK